MKQTNRNSSRRPDDNAAEIKRLQEIIAEKDRQIAELVAASHSHKVETQSIAPGQDSFQSLFSSPIIDLLPDGVVVSDLNGRIQAISPQVLDLYGVADPDYFVGRSMFEFVLPVDLGRATNNYKAFLKGEKIGATSYKSINLKGELLFFEINSAIIGKDKEEGGQIISLVRNLSFRKNLEETLTEKETLLRGIIENSSTIIFIKDKEGHYLNFNTAWAELTGIDRTEARGKTDRELFGEELAQLYRSHDLAVENSNKPLTFEEWFEIKGKIKYFTTTKFPIYGSDGGMKGICGMSTDITDLKLAQKTSDRQVLLQQLLIETANTYIDLPEELLDQTINDSLKKMGEYIGADRFYLFSYDFVAMTASNTHEWCAEGIEPQIEYLQSTPIDELHDWLAAHRQGKPFAIYDVLSLPENEPIRTILEPQGIKSIITVPIMDGEECLGFAGFDSVREHHLFTESDGILLDLFTRSVVNVLNRYKRENELKETTRKLSTLINNLKGFAFRCRFDSDFTMEIISDGIGEISGYKPEELIENSVRSFSSLVLPADLISLRSAIGHAVELQEPYVFEYRILHANGSLRWVWEKGQPVFDRNGIPFLEGFVTDITDRKLAEKALQLSETKYRFIAENTSDGLLVLDQANQPVYVSPAYLKQLGYEESDTSIFRGNYLSRLIHPDDVDEILRSIQNAIANHLPGLTYTYRAQHQNGNYIWLEDNATYLYDELGKLHTSNIISRDITSRRNSEEQIRKLSMAVEQSPVSIVITNLDGNIEYVNPKTEQTTGYSSQELMDQNLRILKSGDEQKAVYDKLWRTITKGLEWRGVIQNRRKNGELYWESSTIAPIMSTAGEITHFIAVKEDITEKINRELEIKRLSMAVEQSPVSIAITDTEGNMVYINSAVMDSSGYSHEELMGANPRIFKSGKTNPEVYKELWDTISAGAEWHGEWMNKRKDGELYWERVSISPIFDEEDSIINYLAVKQDITESKNKENEIRDLNLNLEKKIAQRTRELEKSNRSLMKEIEERIRVENDLQFKTQQLEKFFTVSLDLLCITTLKGEFIELNKAWEETLGFSSQEIRKKRFFDLLHPEDIEPTLEAIEILKSDQSVIGFTNRYRTASGDFRNIEWHSVLVGNLIYGAARDVTDRINLEKSLRESIEREKELNELKSRFVSTASHEFQTPLSSILMSGAALLNYWDKYNREQIASKLENITAKAQHLGEIVTNVMQVSRIQAGQINFNPTTFDLILICRQAIKDIETDYKIRGTIDFQSSHTTLPFFGDRLLILQAMLNLVSNAVKYSQPNPAVTVGVNVENESIVISVADNGIGIPPQAMENLFTPFFRASNVKNIEGNGLGLPIVKDNIDVHHGSIRVETALNKGTKFFISLPIKEKET